MLLDLSKNTKKRTDAMIIPDYLPELEKYRKEKALSVRDMAALIGISKTTYYDWLNGKAPIKIKTYEKIEEFLKNV